MALRTLLLFKWVVIVVLTDRFGEGVGGCGDGGVVGQLWDWCYATLVLHFVPGITFVTLESKLVYWPKGRFRNMRLQRHEHLKKCRPD